MNLWLEVGVANGKGVTPWVEQRLEVGAASKSCSDDWRERGNIFFYNDFLGFFIIFNFFLLYKIFFL